MAEKILLSISILISNRPDTVEKCLKSLDSLRGKISSELILVDTGCGEQVRKMIEPYADRIVDFEWCNDFAKARNAGLRLAKGEWFMYLDDDEWFENTDELEEFFLSGRHRKYNYGHYKVRNYMGADGGRYEEAFVGRLIRMFPGQEFKYAVHEAFAIVRLPLIRLNDFVHHYGYAFKNEDEVRRHTERNLGPLLEEHKKEPGEVRHNAQLVQEYNALREWEKSIDISQAGIRDAVGPSRDRYLGALYANIARVYIYTKRYPDAIELGEKYLGMQLGDELSEATVCYNICNAYFETGEYEKSLKAVRRYRKSYAKWQRDKEIFLPYENILNTYTFSNECSQSVFCMGVRSMIKLGDAAGAKRYFDRIEWNIENRSVDMTVLGLIQNIVRAWLQTDADTARDSYTPMMEVLLGDGVLARIVVTYIEELRKNEPEILEGKEADWPALSEKNWIFLYLKLKNQAEADGNVLVSDYQKLWKETKDALMGSTKLGLWEMAERDGISMGQILTSLPFYQWEQAAEIAVERLAWEDAEKLHGHLSGALSEDNCHMLVWSIPYRLRKIRIMTSGKGVDEKEKRKGPEKEYQGGGQACVSREQVVQELLQYATANQQLYRRLYRDEVFQDTPELLPQGCQASLKLTDMAQAIEAGDFTRAIADVRETLEIMPELSEALKYCTKWISEKSALQSVEQERADYEMRKLAKAVKAQVRNMISQGMLTQAEAALKQLKTLVPEDAEVLQMEKEMLQTSIWRK